MQSVSIYNLNSVNARFNQRDIECLHLQHEKNARNNMISLPSNNWMFSLAANEKSVANGDKKQMNVPIWMLENDLIQV